MGDRARPPDGDDDSRRPTSSGRGVIPSRCAATSRSPAGAPTLRALDVPAGQFVELRALYPRARVHLDRRDAGRRGRRARRDRRRGAGGRRGATSATTRGSRTRSRPLQTLAILLALGAPARPRGRSRSSAALRPRASAPATTGSTSRSRRPRPSRRSCRRCSRRAATPVSFEFTATLFDLIRRGRLPPGPDDDRALDLGRPAQGAGQRPRAVAGRREPAARRRGSARRRRRRRRARRRLRAALALPRADRGGTRGDVEALHGVQGSVGRGVAQPRAGSALRAALPLGVARARLRGIGGDAALRSAIDGWRLGRPALERRRPARPRRLRVPQRGHAGRAALTRRLWRRRTPEAETEAERWEAFRRYLTDFPRLDEAPPASLALWERYLVYGIAFGIADRVLQAAHLHMPEALAQASTIYWISPARRPRLRRDLDVDRRPLLGLRLRARASLVGFGWLRRRLLGRRRAAEAAGRRRRLVRPLPAVAIAIGLMLVSPPAAGATTKRTPPARSRQPCRRHRARRVAARAGTPSASGTARRRRCSSRHAGVVRTRSWSSSTAPEEPPRAGLEAFHGAWDEPGLVLVAPKSKGDTWSLLRSEQDLDLVSVNAALAEAYDRCQIDRTRIAVGGFSDGATYALSLGLSNGDLFPAIMALSPGRNHRGQAGRRPPGLRRSRHARHGPADRGAGDSVVKQLRAAGYPVEYRRFRGGHEASDATSNAAIQWFLAGAPEGGGGGMEREGRGGREGRRALLARISGLVADETTRRLRERIDRGCRDLGAARALVERDRAGDGDVERLRRARQRDRRDTLA